MKTLLALILALPLLAQGQNPQAAAPAEPAKPAPEEGIPVTSPLVISKCGGCHTKDQHGNMLRISWERATPEGWEEAIKRMVRLNGLSLSPDEARSIVKYLATYHGLAPEEAKPVMYYAEHRIQDETNIPYGQCARRMRELPPDGAPAIVAAIGGRLEAARQPACRLISDSRRGFPAGD